MNQKTQSLNRQQARLLTVEEECRIFQMASEDKALLRKLENLDLINSVTENGAGRKILTRALEEHVARQRAESNGRRWRWVATVVVATASLALAVVVWPAGSVHTPKATPSFNQPHISVPSSVGRIFQLRRQPQATVKLDRSGSKPVYKVGENLSLDIVALDDENVYVFEQSETGDIRSLWPSSVRPDSHVDGNERIRVGGEAGMRVEGPPGDRWIRVVLLPPDVKLSSVLTSEVEPRAMVIDLRYAVVPR